MSWAAVSISPSTTWGDETPGPSTTWETISNPSTTWSAENPSESITWSAISGPSTAWIADIIGILPYWEDVEVNFDEVDKYWEED